MASGEDEEPDEVEDPDVVGGPVAVLYSGAAQDIFLEDEYDQDFIADDEESDEIDVP